MSWIISSLIMIIMVINKQVQHGAHDVRIIQAGAARPPVPQAAIGSPAEKEKSASKNPLKKLHNPFKSH